MGKISSLEYFRVPPRWLFVKITDDTGNVGWGEASLEGHTQTVEGCLDAWREQYVGLEAEYESHLIFFGVLLTMVVILSIFGSFRGERPFTEADLSSCPPSLVLISLSGISKVGTTSHPLMKICLTGCSQKTRCSNL